MWHQLDGEVLHDNGCRAWYRANRLHREDGPAVIWPSGREEWWQEGQLHRTRGPAVIDASGLEGWHVRGRDVTREVRAWLGETGRSWPLSQEDGWEVMLRWG